ncbi:hypothetical protein AGMMS50212_12450 [Spirochaetia bacterium]|nr:hypothetical protein AGMMS50212_12450 [Spirochaetia bacterium]
MLLSGARLAAEEAAVSVVRSENDKTPAAIITDIKITGLKRTQPHIALAALEKFRGRDSLALDLNDVKAAVVDTGILDPVNVEIVTSDTGTTLDVKVQDKWAIFPIPLFMFGSDGVSFGGAFFDANAFGINDKMSIAGLYSETHWMINLMYMHAAAKRLPGFILSANYSNSKTERTDQSENVYSRFKTDSIRVMAGLNYPFAQFFNAGLRFSFNYIWLNEFEDAINPPSSGAAHLGIHPSLGWRKVNWDGMLQSERQASVNYHANIDLEKNESIQRVNLQLVWEQSIRTGFRFFGRGGASFSTRITPLSSSSPHDAQVDILPGKFFAQNIAGFQAGFENALFSLKFGTFSVLACYQFVYSYSEPLGGSIDHGPAAGFRIYLRQLAIPAVGLKAGYNIAAQRLQWSFNIGMSM